MISNIANRNISLILAIALFCGLVYCIIGMINKDGEWTSLSSIVLSTAIFTKLYLSYRKAVRDGNLYGKVNPFK